MGTTMQEVGFADVKELRLLRADLRAAAERMTSNEARFLVDEYYTMQRQRIRSANQVRALSEGAEPCSVLARFSGTAGSMEDVVRLALFAFANESPLGKWALAQMGIGPVIAAGLLAHIDIGRARTAGAVWAFAGLDPTRTWEKGQKRPHNAALKTLCWKIGESFVKVSGKDDAFYGRLYAERKAYEVARNEAGDLADQAGTMVKKIPKHAQAATYKAGRLPDGHLHMRAKRWAVKIFLAHYWEVGKLLAGETPPAPYAVAHQGHAHYIPPPGPRVWEQSAEGDKP